MNVRRRVRRTLGALAVTSGLLGGAAPGCHSERAPACQRLRQCCAVASQGGDIEEVRVACTRLDDDQATLCERRLAQVVAAMPKLADEAQCRWP